MGTVDIARVKAPGAVLQHLLSKKVVVIYFQRDLPEASVFKIAVHIFVHKGRNVMSPMFL